MGKDAKDKDGAERALIRDLASLLNETGLSEIEIEKEGLKVRVARQISVQATTYAAPAAVLPRSSAHAPAQTAASALAGPAPSDFAKHPGCVKSPMVGTAYRSPEPGTASFCEVGEIGRAHV